MPCMAASIAYTQGNELSKAPTFAKISRKAATVAVVQQDQQQAAPSVWLSLPRKEEITQAVLNTWFPLKPHFHA